MKEVAINVFIVQGSEWFRGFNDVDIVLETIAFCRDSRKEFAARFRKLEPT